MKRMIILILTIAFLALTACSEGDKPSTDELKTALIQSLPGHFEVNSFSVKATQNFGNKVEPDYGTRFQASVRTISDLYTKDTMKNGALFVRLHTATGKRTEIFGKIQSRLYQGSWRHSVQIDGNPVACLGIPLNQFSEGRVIIRGSDDEKKFHSEIEQKQAEQRKNIANAEKILVGKWRNEDGLSTCRSDGSWHKLWNNGNEGVFLWHMEGDLIRWTWKKYKRKNGEWKPMNGQTEYQQIVYIDSNRYTTKDKKGKISNSTRVQ